MHGEQRHTELVEIARTVKGYAPASGPAHFGFAYHMDFATESRCSVRPNDCIFDPVKLVRDQIEDLLH